MLLAETTTRALGYLLIQAGVTVNGQVGGILLVLVFGSATDYALLLVARYREELRHHERPATAMRLALEQAGPTILASGATVAASLLCLTLADVNSTAGLGPVGAMGVGVATLVMLTALPAILLLGGRRAFWPFVPRYGAEAADATHGPWRRLGERLVRSPRPVAASAVVVLVAMCGGLGLLSNDLTSANGFRSEVESVRGQKLIDQSFPAGANVPTTVIVRAADRAETTRQVLAAAPAVAAVGPARPLPPNDTSLDVTLRADPFDQRAFAAIDDLRERLRATVGSTALIGGPTAEEHDTRVASSRDTKLIIPLVLLVVLIILVALLRSLVAPLLLLATVVLSYLAALGVSAVLFDRAFGFPGEDPNFPLFAFVFLVALGVDYNIFLMSRAREESGRHGTREGILRALAVTGSVITAAGIVLAGTFSVLAVLPITALTQIGVTVAFGVLLDTLLVRSVLVRALVFSLDERTWWPARRRGGNRPGRSDADGAAARRDDTAVRTPGTA